MRILCFFCRNSVISRDLFFYQSTNSHCPSLKADTFKNGVRRGNDVLVATCLPGLWSCREVSYKVLNDISVWVARNLISCTSLRHLAVGIRFHTFIASLHFGKSVESISGKVYDCVNQHPSHLPLLL